MNLNEGEYTYVCRIPPLKPTEVVCGVTLADNHSVRIVPAVRGKCSTEFDFRTVRSTTWPKNHEDSFLSYRRLVRGITSCPKLFINDSAVVDVEHLSTHWLKRNHGDVSLAATRAYNLLECTSILDLVLGGDEIFHGSYGASDTSSIHPEHVPDDFTSYKDILSALCWRVTHFSFYNILFRAKYNVKN